MPTESKSTVGDLTVSRVLCLGPAVNGEGKKNKWYSGHKQRLILLRYHSGLPFLTNLPAPRPHSHAVPCLWYSVHWQIMSQKHSSDSPCCFSSSGPLPPPRSVLWSFLAQMVSHGHLTGLPASCRASPKPGLLKAGKQNF